MRGNQCRKVVVMATLTQSCFATGLFCFAAGACASPIIELKDGSRIVGEIQGIENGMYTVFCPSIGTVHVAQSNISRIVYDGDASAAVASSDRPAAHDNALTGDIQRIEANLAQDPASLQSIVSLQSDPQIQALLNDPVIMKAIQDGDFTSLMNNPKIQALENNERVKQLVRAQEH